MEETINDGGPAFPGVLTNTSDVEKIGLEGETIPPNHQAEYSGMTLRDYFAAKVLAALVGSCPGGTRFGVSHPDTNVNYAKAAYAVADAMLAARGAA